MYENSENDLVFVDSSNYKDKKLNKQKAQAGKSLNWNALFVDHNAVAEVVAEKFGTSKEAILGPQVKGSAAVRLALAETQIVNETKKYLEQMGVRLESFNDVSYLIFSSFIQCKRLWLILGNVLNDSSLHIFNKSQC